MRTRQPARLPALLSALLSALLVAAPALAAGGTPTGTAAGTVAKGPPTRAAHRGVTDVAYASIRRVLHQEAAWLHARDAKAVAPILAAGFIHPVATGQILDRAQHLAWLARHPPDPRLRRRFSALKVRLLGADVAVVNGRVDLRDPKGHLLRQTVFTDVFQRRHGHWLAVSAQETPVHHPAKAR